MALAFTIAALLLGLANMKSVHSVINQQYTKF